MTPLKVAFAGFWFDFDPAKNALLDALAASYEVETVPMNNADLLLYSKHGQEHRSFAGTKVFVTCENLRPRWRHADYCIGHDALSDRRYLRLPYYAMLAIEDAARPFELAPPTPWGERQFCAFIYLNPGPPERQQLFEALSQRQPVTSPGEFLHNADADALEPRRGDWRLSKIAYLQQFRFVITCENSSHPGYTTEKLYDALLAGTIPVYWGNPSVSQDFDPAAFLDAGSFADFDALADAVHAIDADPDRATAILSHAPGMRIPTTEWRRQLEDFLDEAATAALAGKGRRSAQLRATRLVAQAAAARAMRRVRHVLKTRPTPARH